MIPEQVVDSLDAGRQADVPVLAGFNAGETRSLRMLVPPKPATAQDYEERIAAAYGDDAARFLTIYPSGDLEESMLGAVRDALYGWTAQRLAVKQRARGAPAYLYLFDHDYPAASELGLRAFHGAELPFMFGTIWQTADNWPRIPRTADQRALSDAMVQYWASFARSGRPVAEGQADWPAFGEAENVMVFDEQPRVVRDVLGDRYDFYERTVCRRRAAGDQQWNWNVGVASPPLPPLEGNCR